MDKPTFTGVISATLTPFVSEVGGVDTAWIRDHLRFLESNGVHGVLALGTTGEGPSMSVEERQQVLDSVMQHRGNLFVFAGTGCASLADTVRLSVYALECGVDAVLVMPPFYFKSVEDAGVLRYFQALCDALPSSARVLLYHIPVVTGVAITPPVIEGLLASHGGQFYGIKDSSGDVQHTTMLVQNYPQLHIYSGSDSQAGPSLACGVAGAISALSNVWPDRVRAVFDAHMQGHDTTVAQSRLSALRKALTMPHMPPVLKALLPTVSGLPRTSVRSPLVNLSDDETAQLWEMLKPL